MFSRILLIAVFLSLSSIMLIYGGGGHCPQLKAPHNGVVDRHCGTRVGNVCRIYCKKGCQLIGDAIHQCLSNCTWSGTPTQCVSPNHRHHGCPHLDAPDNGYKVSDCNNRVGCICVFACNSGYTLVGPSRVVCQKNCKWSHIPTCVATPTAMTTVCHSCLDDRHSDETTTTTATPAAAYCPALRVPSNGVLSGSCRVASPGALCQFACNSGYQLSGTTISLCQTNGMWNNTVQCIPTRTRCASLSPPNNGVIVGYCAPGISGQSCQFSCNTGYELVGSAILTCQPSGLWSRQTPVCVTI